jgi:NADPH-dependent curcumin reductase
MPTTTSRVSRRPDMENKRVVLASRPAGWVTEENFRLEPSPVPAPKDGEVLVKNLWLSLDPYMRGRMSDAKSYVKGVDLGEVMVGQTVGEVVESRNPKLKKGDAVLTQLGWQLYGCTAEAARVDPSRAPLSYYLGVLGMPGMTAYFGLKEIGQPKAGNTVVVSAASGAVGSVAGQLARLWGCRAVGIAGGPQKCRYVVEELGFEACIDHKAGRLHEDLAKACPDGVDVHFENVGGEILDTMLRLMNLNSRIVVCGLISEYNATQPYGYRNMRAVLVNRIRMQGMIVFDWKERYGEALKVVGEALAQGRLKYRESIVHGLENAPQGLIALLKGGNFGKQLVKLA